MASIVTQITSIIKTAHDKIIYGFIERLQMFHLIKFYQEINALEFIKVIEGCFGGDAEPLCKCSYASVNIRYLIFVSHTVIISVMVQKIVGKPA